MREHEVTGPTYDELRPAKKPEGMGMAGPPPRPKPKPVYEHLEETLAHPDTGDPGEGERGVVPHVLATLSAYAYSDTKTVATVATRLGLEKSRCLMISQDVDAMFIRSTAYLLQSRHGDVAILCYRGTEPMNLINWLTDADVNPQKLVFPGGHFRVHAGFYRNVRATEPEVVEALHRACDGKSIYEDGGDVDHPLKALYIAGHSLGGAMAATMAIVLAMTDAYEDISPKLRVVYTYGQPMIGSGFAELATNPKFSRVRDRLFRYIYRNDVVAALPPGVTGTFEHFGREYRYLDDKWRYDAKPIGQMKDLLGLPLALGSFVAQMFWVGRRLDKLLPSPYSLYDHEPQHYLAALGPEGGEFGD